MEKTWDILGIGSAAVDDLLFVDHFPQPDEKMPVQGRQRRGGGQAATALVTAARQGARTAFYSRFGEDVLSNFTVEDLERYGVDCSLVTRSPGCGPIYSVVIVDAAAGSRTILYSLDDFHEPDPAGLEPDWIERARLVFIDQNTPLAGLQAARLARARGIPVVADLEKTNTPGLDLLLSHIDHLIVSLDFARRLTARPSVEEMLPALAGPSPRPVTLVTCGSAGCWYSEWGGPAQYFPAFPVTVVDTTGCGDIFHGAYAAAIARGLQVPRAVAIASASAALKAAQGNGRAGIPDLAAVEQFLIQRS